MVHHCRARLSEQFTQSAGSVGCHGIQTIHKTVHALDFVMPIVNINNKKKRYASGHFPSSRVTWLRVTHGSAMKEGDVVFC